MNKWFAEVLFVLACSRRTWGAIIFGIVGYVAISLWGNYHVSNVEFSGNSGAMEEAVKNVSHSIYDWMALGWLAISVISVIKAYHKDKKKILGLR